MKKTRRLLAVIPLLLAPAATVAAGPFSIHRATSPAAVAGAPPVAVVATSPFEDGGGALVDGSNYYYAVHDASGAPVRLSLTANPALETVRVAFDDGISVSAVASATRSSVVVSPASIPADGASVASATIVPRDGNGIVLGTGLAVEVDAVALWPGVVRGSIDDRGDGTYVATIVSSVPGDASVRVRVEGVTLASEPALAYVSAQGAGTLREQAWELLSGLGAESGPLETLASSGSAFAAALSEVRAAADALAPGDPARDKQDVMHALDAALRDLAVAAATDARATLLMDDLLVAARLVAAYHLTLATSLCGACDGLSPDKVCAAEAYLAEGDAVAGSDPARAVDAYTRAVDAGIQAEKLCS